MAKSKNKYQTIILDILGTRPIAFNPDLATMLGSANAGLFFSQLLYWHKKGRNKEMFYKTVQEMKQETTLTKTQQLSAQKRCVRAGVLEVLYKGIPPKRHFKVNIEKTIELLSELEQEGVVTKKSKRQETEHSNVSFSDEELSAFLSDITENTSETTFREVPTYSRGKHQKVFSDEVPSRINIKVKLRDYEPEFIKKARKNNGRKKLTQK